MKRVEESDNQGDTKAVYQGVNTLSGKSRKRFSKQPTRRKNKKQSDEASGEWDTIDSPDELGAV